MKGTKIMLALGLDTFYVSPGSTSRNKTKTCFIEHVADWPILMNFDEYSSRCQPRHYLGTITPP